MFHMYHTFLE